MRWSSQPKLRPAIRSRPRDVVVEQARELLAERRRDLGLGRRAGVRVVDDPLDQPAQRLGQAVEVAIQGPQPGSRTARSMSRNRSLPLPVPVSHSRSNCCDVKLGVDAQERRTARRIVARTLGLQLLAGDDLDPLGAELPRGRARAGTRSGCGST